MPWRTDAGEGPCRQGASIASIDVFIRDLQTGTTRIASRRESNVTEPCYPKDHGWDPDVGACEDAWDPSITNDGHWVGFRSWAPNLPGGTGLTRDLYVAGPFFASVE